MNVHDATEQAFKRGYEKGAKEIAKRIQGFLLENFCVSDEDVDNLWKHIDNLIMELKYD